MFDDVSPPQSGSTPPNLPLGEPEDMFEKTDSALSSDTDFVQPAAPINTALDAGVLKPKTEMGGGEPISPLPQPQTPAYTIQTTPQPFLNGEQGVSRAVENAPQEAPFSGRKILIFISIILILIVLGLGSLWIYTSFIKKNTGDNFGIPTTNTQTNTVNSPNQVTTPIVPTTPSSEIVNPTSTNSTEDSILFGEPVDTDSDGIFDVDEAKYGTNTLNWDTDSDGLSDGDEVMIWKTNPLKMDTDGDGYGDGAEIKNGYNPSGTGKLFEPPTSTAATATGTP